MASTDKAGLTVIARAPFHVYYEGTAQAVSAANTVGQFDILPGHADFFSILEPGEVIIDTSTSEPVKFYISNGIVAVRDDEVMLFVNI
jgi:F0F1-type ATP synthase epsilon subunit